jgi:hypothetical protein
MIYFILNNNRLDLGSSFIHNDIQYPPNWLELSTESDRESIGILGPFELPNYDSNIEYLKWNNLTLSYDIILYTEEELLSICKSKANYLLFWDLLLASNVYSSIREQSFTSLKMNTLVTEFVALIGDAKLGRPNESAIQYSIKFILSCGIFTEENFVELNDILERSYLNNIYTLTNDI